MVEYEVPCIEILTQFRMKKNTYNVPSSVRHPKNAPSVSLNLVPSPNMVKKALKVSEYEQNAYQVQKGLKYEQKKLQYEQKKLQYEQKKPQYEQKKPQYKQKKLQYKEKTSSDPNATHASRTSGLSQSTDALCPDTQSYRSRQTDHSIHNPVIYGYCYFRFLIYET